MKTNVNNNSCLSQLLVKTKQVDLLTNWQISTKSRCLHTNFRFHNKNITSVYHIYDCSRKLSTFDIVSSAKYKPYQIDAHSVAPAE